MESPPNNRLQRTRFEHIFQWQGRARAAEPECYLLARCVAEEANMRVVNKAQLSAEQLAGIERELSGQQNLGDVMKWALAHPAGIFTGPTYPVRCRMC